MKGMKTGLLLEVKKPLERTPHFFGPGDDECVNASGQLVPIVGLEPTYSRFLNSFKVPSESLNGILDAIARALANSYSNGQINRFAIFHPLKPTKGGLEKRDDNSTAPASRWWVWLESNQLPRGGPCPALPSATYPSEGTKMLFHRHVFF